jgi:hypothetical protein
MLCGISSSITGTVARLPVDGIKNDVAKKSNPCKSSGVLSGFILAQKNRAGTRRKRRKRISQLRKSGQKYIKKTNKFYTVPAKKCSYQQRIILNLSPAGTLFPIDAAKPHHLGLYFAGNSTIIGSPVTSKFL